MRRSSTVTAQLDEALHTMVMEMRRQHPELPTQRLSEWVAMRAMHLVGADASTTRKAIERARYERRHYPRSRVDAVAERPRPRAMQLTKW